MLEICILFKKSTQTQQSLQAGCVNYTKSTCLSALTEINTCLSGAHKNSTSINIAANVNQNSNDNIAQLIISGLPLLGATELCKSSFIPFMCLYLFPLCDGDGITYKPSMDQCIEISTVLCKDEWKQAQRIAAVREQLPACHDLPIATSVCLGKE